MTRQFKRTYGLTPGRWMALTTDSSRETAKPRAGSSPRAVAAVPYLRVWRSLARVSIATAATALEETATLTPLARARALLGVASPKSWVAIAAVFAAPTSPTTRRRRRRIQC